MLCFLRNIQFELNIYKSKANIIYMILDHFVCVRRKKYED